MYLVSRWLRAHDTTRQLDSVSSFLRFCDGRVARFAARDVCHPNPKRNSILGHS
jgi:hypothetical protein